MPDERRAPEGRPSSADLAGAASAEGKLREGSDAPAECLSVFREIDLSQAVPPNTVAVTFRYRITCPGDTVRPHAELADNAQGHASVLLAGESGKVTVRLRTAQKLYYSLPDPRLHLSLWVVAHQALSKHSC